MEVLLNVTWLMVAVGAFFYWQAQVEGAARRREHKSRYRLLALTVALLLLFPVISLTDDLHAEQAAMEDSSRSLMKARNIAQGCPGAGSASFVAVVTHPPFPAAVLHCFLGLVVQLEAPLLSLTQVSAHDGRSPPFNV